MSIVGFRYELALCLSGAVPVPNMAASEVDVFSKFRSDTNQKNHFVYLLINPSSTIEQGVATRSSPVENLKQFAVSIFYVGKGKNARSTQHLKEAKVVTNKVRVLFHYQQYIYSYDQSRKAERIRKIWSSGCGIVCLQVYHNISAPEAFCREAAIIDAIGMCSVTYS